MAKIFILLPKQYMAEQAEMVIKEDGFTIEKIKVIETVDSVEEARKCIDMGANIIVARGIQAQLIKSHTNIPVVDITMTAQEIGLLVIESKRIIKKKKPSIAIVSLKNMIGDISYFDKLFDIKMSCYYTEEFDQIDFAVEKAVADGADIILGGDRVLRLVERHNIPALFLRSTKDSIREALLVAQKMAYAIEVEKSSKAQIETMLDTAFNGIIKIDRNHKILIVNRIIEDILGKTASGVIGNQLEEEITDFDYQIIEQVLDGERDIFSTSIKIKGTPLLFLVAPIQYDNEITGAILSCRKIMNASQSEKKAMQDMYLYGFNAREDFSSLKTKAPKLRESIELGKRFALSKRPVLICGEEGTEQEMFAQCIHNNSTRKNFPFLTFNCSGMSEKMQYEYLFGTHGSQEKQEGSNGVLQACNFGTIYISEIENLGLINQYELYKSICSQELMTGDMRIGKQYDVRIIAGTHTDLNLLVNKGTFRKDLYYSLNAFTLNIPPIRKRGEDIERMVYKYLERFKHTYSTFLTITDDALKAIKEYSWEGNLIQLENFCERLFLTTAKKNIDEAMVRSLLAELYPYVRSIEGEECIVIYKHPETEEIVQLLKKYHGNRNAVAKELNISTTTLWRRMKKYGITNNYD